MLCARTGQLIPSFGYGKLSRAKEGDQVAIDCSDSGRVDLWIWKRCTATKLGRSDLHILYKLTVSRPNSI
jgi:hypothetical protein